MGLSIFIMYSPDRIQQLQHTLSFLQKMPEYTAAQKILLVDGLPNIELSNFEIIQVPRKSGQFVWASMWAAGVNASFYEDIFYIDSDRLLPPEFLTKALQQIASKTFVFTSQHFQILDNPGINLSKLWTRVDNVFKKDVIDDFDLWKYVKLDLKTMIPNHRPGKNVMSGAVLFKKQTFLELGGVDPFYCNHGAFADTDFHMTAHQSGCSFVDLKLTELHCHHTKDCLVHDDIELLTLENFIYYLAKWKLEPCLAYDMAANLEISPNDVFAKFKEFSKEFV